jgi:hypothetical protein
MFMYNQKFRFDGGFMPTHYQSCLTWIGTAASRMDADYKLKSTITTVTRRDTTCIVTSSLLKNPSQSGAYYDSLLF